jgi:HD-GYP domain-containing protein (c-di-GMP phosphodiesterase class II)
MQSLTTPTTHPTALKIFEILREREYGGLSAPSKQHREERLARQVANLLDVALPWQRGHGRRTAAVAQVIGSAAGLCRDALHHLTLAALLHDIGLLALPNAFASPIGYLDVDSYADVQCHPRLGAQWLESFPFLRHASVIIAHHHERWDGSGYPYGIRGPFIPLEARVLAIADAFDAIQVPGVTDQETRGRVAYRILTVASGTQFDPQLVEICAHCLQRQTHVSLID